VIFCTATKSREDRTGRRKHYRVRRRERRRRGEEGEVCFGMKWSMRRVRGVAPVSALAVRRAVMH
jgi:hypothetical protein